MTNREYMIGLLSSSGFVDDGGASYEAMVYYDVAGYAACAAEVAGGAETEPAETAAPAPMAADQQEDKAEVMAGLKKKCDPAPKTGARRKDLDDGKIRALRKAGWTLEKIADEMGCAPQTIKNRLDEYKAESAT